MIRESRGFDILKASDEEILAAMNRGVRAALRRHKQAGVPAVVWNRETGEIVHLPPDQIPDFPDEDEETEGQAEPG